MGKIENGTLPKIAAKDPKSHLISETVSKEEIIVPPGVIRPFALWLTQRLQEPIINIAGNLHAEISYVQNGVEKKCGDMMRKKLGEVIATLFSLRKAKEVKLVSPKKGDWETGWEFEFSDEKQDKELADKKILIDNALLNKIASALNHRIGSSLTPIHAQAGVIENRSAVKETENRVKSIHSSTSEIHLLLKALLNEKSDMLLIIKGGEAEEYVDHWTPYYYEGFEEGEINA